MARGRPNGRCVDGGIRVGTDPFDCNKDAWLHLIWKPFTQQPMSAERAMAISEHPMLQKIYR